MLRVLFFVEASHRMGGAHRSLLAVLPALPGLGISPLVVFPAEGIAPDAFRGRGLEVRVVPAPGSLLTFGQRHFDVGILGRGTLFVRDVLPYGRRLLALAREEAVEAWHFNTPRGILVAGLAARFHRRPSVLHLRGTVPISAIYWSAAQLLADRVVLVARALEGELGARQRARCRVIYNGVSVGPDPDRPAARRALARRLGARPEALDGAPLFVSLSALVPFKGLHHLLAAAADLRSRGVAAHYVLASASEDESYGAWLRRRTAELRLEDVVHFVGSVADPSALLAGADALVLPSVESERLAMGGGPTLEVRGTEGLPRAVLEAMAASLPVVASRVAGVEEQVEEGRSGLIVPPGDPSALAAALERVARDPAWRAAAGALARQVALERFNVETSARGLGELLHEVVGARRRKGP